MINKYLYSLSITMILILWFQSFVSWSWKEEYINAIYEANINHFQRDLEYIGATKILSYEKSFFPIFPIDAYTWVFNVTNNYLDLQIAQIRINSGENETIAELSESLFSIVYGDTYKTIDSLSLYNNTICMQLKKDTVDWYFFSCFYKISPDVILFYNLIDNNRRYNIESFYADFIFPIYKQNHFFDDTYFFTLDTFSIFFTDVDECVFTKKKHSYKLLWIDTVSLPLGLLLIHVNNSNPLYYLNKSLPVIITRLDNKKVIEPIDAMVIDKNSVSIQIYDFHKKQFSDSVIQLEKNHFDYDLAICPLVNKKNELIKIATEKLLEKYKNRNYDYKDLKDAFVRMIYKAKERNDWNTIFYLLSIWKEIEPRIKDDYYNELKNKFKGTVYDFDVIQKNEVRTIFRSLNNLIQTIESD